MWKLYFEIMHYLVIFMEDLRYEGGRLHLFKIFCQSSKLQQRHNKSQDEC